MSDLLSDEDLQQRLEQLGEHIAAHKRRIAGPASGLGILQTLEQRQLAALDRLSRARRADSGGWTALRDEAVTDYHAIAVAFRDRIERHDRDHGPY
jgi:hypothetical protein